MRDIKEILASDRFIEDKNKWFTFDGFLVSGFLTLPGVKKQLQCVVGIEPDKLFNLDWEHVSVKFCGTMNKTPSWEVMCAVKDFFWLPEEEVHQIHPKESEYLHGVGCMKDVLHLWRPVGGWNCEVKNGDSTD